MELLIQIIFPMLSMLSSGIVYTDLPAAASASTRHLRPKRCSCATFLDKECVYFCHLDIIWVNTPERTVSYGLGIAPRKKRSVRKTPRAAELPRCECAHGTDGTCVSFCHTRNPQRRKAAHDKVIPPTSSCRNDPTVEIPGIKSSRKRALPWFVRVTRQLQLLLKDRNEVVPQGPRWCC